MSRKHVSDTQLTLTRLQEAEQEYIKAQFDFYDYSKSGMIARHLAQKVLLNIGVEPSVIALPEKINFADLCVFIDGKLPDPDPSLECSLFTFTRMVGEPDEEGRSDRIIRPKAICDFMTSLDRPAPTISEADMLLTQMLDYDNVEKDTRVSDKLFCRELQGFAKSSNALREFR